MVSACSTPTPWCTAMALHDVHYCVVTVLGSRAATRAWKPASGLQCASAIVILALLACCRSQMPRVARDCVIGEQSAFETMHPHAGYLPCADLPLEIPLTSADRQGPTYKGALEGWIRNAY